MVKYALPTEPLPTVYKIDLDTTDHDEVDLGPSYKEVPTCKYGSVNLKKYESFKIARSNIKLNNQEALAIQQLTQWLDNIDINLNSMNIQLLVDVVNYLHSFFIYGCQKDRQDSIDRVMYRCMLKYFKNDKDILNVVLKSCERLIKKSTKLSRRVAKVRNFLHMAAGSICSLVLRKN